MWTDNLGRLFPEGTRITGRPLPEGSRIPAGTKNHITKEWEELTALEDAGLIYKDPYARNIIENPRRAAARHNAKMKRHNEGLHG